MMKDNTFYASGAILGGITAATNMPELVDAALLTIPLASRALLIPYNFIYNVHLQLSDYANKVAVDSKMTTIQTEYGKFKRNTRVFSHIGHTIGVGATTLSTFGLVNLL